jgi:FMN phosphatase YigB (HAD superfamily)
MDKKEQATKLICFDLDDTLIDDNWKFEITFCDCTKAILLGLAAKAPMIDEILLTARELDNRLLKELPKDKKFTPERLVEAWQTTYRIISEKQGIPVKPHIMSMLEAFVMQNYEPPYLVIAGAVDALLRIRNKWPHVRMEILSVGDPEIQLRKITYSRLNYYFDRIEIVQDGSDKKEYLEAKAKEFGPDNVIMVGNSISTDANSALDAGVKAVHIPRGGWSQFKAEPRHDGYVRVRRIFELPDALVDLLEPKVVAVNN